MANSRQFGAILTEKLACFEQIFHLSGIISALFAGMVCNHYAWYNLTPLAQELSKHFYEQMMLVRF